MAYQVYESNLAQSANLSAGNAVASLITSTGSDEGAVDLYNTVFDAAFAKLKAVWDKDGEAQESAKEAPKKAQAAKQADDDPGSVAFNFGAFKGLSVAEVSKMSAEEAKAHGEKLVADGWAGTPYEKSGQEYLDYVTGSSNKRLGFMKRVVENFLDSKRA